MQSQTEVIPVKLANSKEIHVQATLIGGEQEIAARIPSFADVTDAIEEISNTLAASLAKIKPQKASVEFGVEIAVESGRLTAILVKGTGSASLKVTLEWGNVDYFKTN